MDFFFSTRGRNGDSAPSERIIDQGVQMCPFLRNINEPTNFCSSSPIRFPTPVKGVRGPIFEDGPSFETAFRLFHGHDGVVPLSGRSSVHIPETLSDADNTASTKFHPFAASAATISLSTFGPGGPFSFDFFMKEHKRNKKTKKRREMNEKKKSDQLQECETRNPIKDCWRWDQRKIFQLGKENVVICLMQQVVLQMQRNDRHQ